MAHARVEWALPSLCDWSSVTKRGTRASLPLLEGCIDGATEVDTLSAVDANRRLHKLAPFVRWGVRSVRGSPNRRCWSGDSAQGRKKKKRILLVHPTKFLSSPLTAG